MKSNSLAFYGLLLDELSGIADEADEDGTVSETSLD